MPTRPINHQTADEALTAVERLFTECGCATQRVYPDYGEDLVVQPSLNGTIDPNRIWVQVKGTRDRDRFRVKDGYRLRVSTETALKWARSSDTVVAVLWDVVEKTGVWAIPADQIEDWDLIFDRPNTLGLFLPDEEFNLQAAEDCIWDARLRHYSNLLLLSEAVAAFNAGVEPDEEVSSLWPVVAFDFLRMVGFFEEGDEPVTQQLLGDYLGAAERLAREEGVEKHEARATIAMLMVAAKVEKVSERPFPGPLIESCGGLAQQILDGVAALDLDSGEPDVF